MKEDSKHECTCNSGKASVCSGGCNCYNQFKAEQDKPKVKASGKGTILSFIDKVNPWKKTE